jgi:hypothetical protein
MPVAYASRPSVAMSSRDVYTSTDDVTVTLRDYPQDDEGRLLPDDEVRGSI